MSPKPREYNAMQRNRVQCKRESYKYITEKRWKLNISHQNWIESLGFLNNVKETWIESYSAMHIMQ
jgi:hypothetical protein